MRVGLLEKYGGRLNMAPSQIVSLCEGSTPLIPAPRLSEWVAPGCELYLKYEGLNPTGSFKDRGMTAAISQAVSDGAKTVICASTGNTAASAAAYSARAGLKCIVLIPKGKIALGKLAGAIAYGAQVVSIKGSFDDGLHLVREVGERTPIAVVNSINPFRLEGQKTAAWEICEDLGSAPDWLCLPVGNAGNITSYWMGFNACSSCVCSKKPQLLGAQAEGAAPLVLGHTVLKPETRATAIRIGNPARGDQALTAIKESGGNLLAVSDHEIFEAYRKIAQTEGVFCEPSSAAGIAGMRKCVQSNSVSLEGQRIVAVLTGNGLKDPASATENVNEPATIDATLDALMSEIAR